MVVVEEEEDEETNIQPEEVRLSRGFRSPNSVESVARGYQQRQTRFFHTFV